MFTVFLHPVDCLVGRARMRAQRHARHGRVHTLMQVIVLPLAYRCRQRLSRWLYQRWPALAGNGRSALSPAQPLPARKAKILLAVLYMKNGGQTHSREWVLPIPNVCDWPYLGKINMNYHSPHEIWTFGTIWFDTRRRITDIQYQRAVF